MQARSCRRAGEESAVTEVTATVSLRSGEQVALTVVRAPDPQWAGVIEPMLQHKGPPWTWQNAELLRAETGLVTRFYVLHRDRAPFANIMLVETNGVALLGHVWTEAADRGGGASGRLMERLLADFEQRQGRAIFLGTDPDSAPWHFYRRRGFEPIEEGSGCMARYWQPREQFDAEWYASGELRIESLDWRHWVAACPLASSGFPGLVRLAATGLIGRRLSEGPFLPLLQEQRRCRAAGEADCAVVLTGAGGAVHGWASCLADPCWPHLSMLDLYCSPAGWPEAEGLIRAVLHSRAGRLVAYADAGFTAKESALRSTGFQPVATLPGWIRDNGAVAGGKDVIVWEISA
jgi:hypothetical protein